MSERDAKSIFLAAVDKPTSAERDAYLAGACVGDDQLRQRVEALLKAHDAPDSFLEQPAVGRMQEAQTLPPSPITEGPGTVLGHYKLLQQIGEGGMGVVYLAEQEEPVRRKVALKIIKPGMDTQQVIARFEAERQALAMMEHQHIARVLDAGATHTGRPYFVMELVKGIPITEYCDNNKLTPRERLRLFIPVCQAIQHAHQKGVIHRDVKPSNVLVCMYDGQPVPKVIDFGVAKAIEQRLTERTMFTQHGTVVGTLQYMSPEQAEMSQLDIDTRSDIYSLGVLLYELLTGSTPITKKQLRERGFAEMLVLIYAQEPVRPSTRLSESADELPTISAQRKTDPKKLSLLLRGELDWIVMKALEKDRTRRYDTASSFAADIQRHLDDEPVEACPPSAAYRLRKFARKHRATLATAAAFAALLIAGVFVSTWQAVRATDAEAQARSSALQALANETRARAAAEAEKQAKDAEAAQRKRAEVERQRAIDAAETALDQLSHSLFQNARSLLSSDAPGRRWAALEMLRGAEGLRIRQGVESIEDMLEPKSKQASVDSLAADLALGHLSRLAGGKPSQSELRTQALNALLTRDGRVVREWSGMAHSVSPDGRFAASLVIDLQQDTGAVVITDLANGKERSRWEGAQAEKLGGTFIALGPQAKRLASVSLDMRQVNVWELPELDLLGKLTLPQAGATAPSSSKTLGSTLEALIPPAMRGALMPSKIAFSPSGRFVAGVTLGPHGQVVVWDLQNGNDGRVAGRMEQAWGNVSFSPDSRLLAFASAGTKATLWNLEEQRVDQELEFPLPLTGSLVFTPQGQLAIRCYGSPETHVNQTGVTTMLLVWDIVADKEARRIALDTSAAFGGISISPDGTRTAIADFNGPIAVYGINDDVIPVKLDHGAQVQLLEWAHQGRRLLSGGFGTLRMWEFADDMPLQTLSLEFDSQQRRISAFALSPDGRQLAVEAPGASEIALFDRTSGKQIRKLTYEETAPSPLLRLAFSPDSRQLIRLGIHRLIGWDVETGSQRIRIESKLNGSQTQTFFSIGVREDGRIVIGGLRDYRPVAFMAGEDTPIWRGEARGGLAVVSPDGRLATDFNSGMLTSNKPTTVYDLSTGEPRFQLSGFPEKATQPIGDFSPDSRWLLRINIQGLVAAGLSAVAQTSGSVGLGRLGMGTQEQPWSGGIWNVSTGEKHLELAGTSNPTTYAFSPDGRYLAVFMRNGSIRLWNVDAKTEMFEWQPSADKSPGGTAVNHIAFAADSTSLVVPDGNSPVLRMLNLTLLEKSLDEYGLGW